MENLPRPDLNLARSVLPKPLLDSINHIFNQKITSCMLVGGTALSGFYAGHRRSDDIDLFAADSNSYMQTCLAVKSLESIGCSLTEISRSNQYYKAQGELRKHTFSIDVVLDQAIFKTGKSLVAGKKIIVANLPTLTKMKSAALLSRCSEKDLYDLLWIFQNTEDYTVSKMVAAGSDIDAGLNAETLLYSVSSANLEQKACSFSTDKNNTSKKVFGQISRFRDELKKQLHLYLTRDIDSDIKNIVKKLKKL